MHQQDIPADSIAQIRRLLHRADIYLKLASMVRDRNTAALFQEFADNLILTAEHIEAELLVRAPSFASLLTPGRDILAAE